MDSPDGKESALQVVVWSPKWEEFGGLDTSKKWKHKVRILKQEKRLLHKELEELKQFTRSLEEESESLTAENMALKRELDKVRAELEKYVPKEEWVAEENWLEWD